MRKLPSAVCRLPSAIWRLPPAACRLPSAICLLLAAALACLPEARAATTPPAADLDAELGAARKAVLADPLDVAAAARLAELRKKQKERAVEALAALEAGLDAYLAGRWAAAAAELKKATACPQVVKMADALLVKTLAEVVRICQDKAGPAPGAAAAPKVCPKCGNTGLADCTEEGCHASGFIRCQACDGLGKIDPSKSRTPCLVCDGKGRRSTGTTCSACNGKGSLPPSKSSSSYLRSCSKCGSKGEAECPTCRGRGVVPCTCGAKPSVESPPDATPPTPESPIGSNEAAAAKKAIAKARFLREGGVDLESPEALECSPKLTK